MIFNISHIEPYHSIRPVHVGGFNLGSIPVPVSPEHPANAGMESDPSGRLQVILQQNSPGDQVRTTNLSNEIYLAPSSKLATSMVSLPASVQ